MMSYINETDFVIENKELVYPEIITDGLQLYYDAKGKRDTDYHRDTMLDMSGNKNHGELQNFAYEKHSGYKDGLVFDYIDDKLVRPELDLKPDDFTFMLNGNIISFSPDGTVKRVQDGEVIESKGFNMVRNGDFADGMSRWSFPNLKLISRENGIGKFETTSSETAFVHQSINKNSFSENDLIYTSLESHIPHSATSKYIRWFDYENITLTGSSSDSLTRWSGVFRTGEPHPDYGATIRHHAQGSPGTIIKLGRYVFVNLTRAFGAGNEPTKEQMDEIINRFGFIPNTQDLIDRIEYKGNDLGDMENIIDGLYKTEVLSGEEIFTDKADDAVVHVEIDGKSYQHAGSGKNLFNKYLLSDRNNYQLATYSASPAIQLKPNTAYILSASRVNPSPDGNQLVLNIMDATGGIPIYGNPDYNDKRIRAAFNMVASHSGFDNFTNTFITPESGLISFSYYDNKLGKSSEGNWFTDVMIDAQLEEGSVVTEYEPPVQSPEYPIKIHSLNDFDVVSSKGKRNLISVKDMRINGTSATSNGQNVLLENVYGYPAGILAKDVIQAGKTYTMSHKERLVSGEYNTGTSGSIRFYDPSGVSPTMSTTRTNPVRTFSYESISDTLQLFLYGSHTGTIDFSEIKIEESNAITPYNPSEKDITEDSNHPSIDKINILLDEPLRSAGDAKDRLFRDNDGLWKIERNVHYEELSSSTPSWFAYTGYDKDNSISTRLVRSSHTHSILWEDIRSSHFLEKASSWNVDEAGIGYSATGGASIWIQIPRSIANNLEEAKQWANRQQSQGTPVQVMYSLEENRYIETLSQSLQDKLNNLRSFSESNYVYTVDGSTNLLDTVPLLNNHWYPSSGVQQNPVSSNGQTATQEPLPVYPGVKIHLTKETTVDNYWRIVWVDKNNNLVRREVSTVNDLILTAPNGAYGMRVSYPNGSNPVIKFDKSDISQAVYENLKPTLHAKFLYNNWYKEDRVINNLMIYNRALANEEMLQNYKTVKRRWGM